MEALTETFDELNLGCEKTLNKQFNEGGKYGFGCAFDKINVEWNV